MMKTNIGRRNFLKQSGATLFYGALITRAQTPPSERIRVAHVGTGGMGGAHINAFSAMPDVETVALCDVDSTRLAASAQRLVQRKPTAKPQTYADYRRILERKDIDVVTCATPDHWHALVAIHAFEAGKDVYGEKPLSYSLREGQRMEQTQRRTGAVFQLGTQIHAGDNYHRVAEIINPVFWARSAPSACGRPAARADSDPRQPKAAGHVGLEHGLARRRMRVHAGTLPRHFPLFLRLFGRRVCGLLVPHRRYTLHVAAARGVDDD